MEVERVREARAVSEKGELGGWKMTFSTNLNLFISPLEEFCHGGGFYFSINYA